MQSLCKYIAYACAAAGSCGSAPPQHAAAQHVDILVQVREGRLTTGSFELEGDERREEVRVFSVSMPDVAPVYAQEPGFSALPESGLAPGSRLGFDLAGPLEFWPGGGPVHFVPAASEALRIKVGPQQVDLRGDSPGTAGYDFAQVNAQGALHRHPTYLLGEGDVEPGAAPPQPGLYAASLALRSSDPAIAPAAPLWLVFDYQASATAGPAALEWLNDYRVLGLTPGDAQGDGRVDLADFAVLKRHFGLPGARREGDFNGDRFVDLADFSLLKQNFGTVAPAAAVPEPSAVALALLGLLALMCPGRRRRRELITGRL